MNISRSTVVIAASAFAFLAGCASDVKLDDKPAPVEIRTPISPSTSPNVGATPGGTSQSAVTSVDLTKNQDTAPAAMDRVVYFDYDSFVVKDEFRSTLDTHAKALVATRGKKLSLEGHTDERGGSEYNLALGQKRAESVLKALTLLGATEAQLEAVSFGKERPAVRGNDESAWAKNRRVELNGR